jgi:RNA 2',3'-cyclic 3'-phosphodiesterase
MAAPDSSGGTIRAFIAAEISDEVRARVGELLTKLKRTEAEVKWVRPASMHLTLRFLGNIFPDQVELIDAAMNEAVAGMAPVAVEVEGAGVFPNPDRPRVLWLGLSRGGPELTALAERLNAALSARGFGPADRPFAPHLTLGRVKTPRNLRPALKTLEAEAARSFGGYTAGRVILFESELNRAGAKYTELASAALADGDSSPSFPRDRLR